MSVIYKPNHLAAETLHWRLGVGRRLSIWGVRSWWPQWRHRAWYIPIQTRAWTLIGINTFRPKQNGRHFPDDILRCILLNENVWISLKISLKFIPKVWINNIPALVPIMAWRRPGDKPLSEPMMISLLTHICVTRPQWVKPSSQTTLTYSQIAAPCPFSLLLWCPIETMMTSSNGNIFHVIGHLCGEFTDHRWIFPTKASDAELWYFFWPAPQQTVEQTLEMAVICDSHRTHYDVTTTQC